MRKLTKTSILNQHELVLLNQELRKLVGEKISRIAEGYGVDTDAMLRFMAVAEKCRIAREEKGLSLKEAARKLKMPQYRLKDIERADLKVIDSAALILYTEFLGIRRWFSRWGAQNSVLYKKLKSSASQRR